MLGNDIQMLCIKQSNIVAANLLDMQRLHSLLLRPAHLHGGRREGRGGGVRGKGEEGGGRGELVLVQ